MLQRYQATLNKMVGPVSVLIISPLAQWSLKQSMETQWPEQSLCMGPTTWISLTKANLAMPIAPNTTHKQQRPMSSNSVV